MGGVAMLAVFFGGAIVTTLAFAEKLRLDRLASTGVGPRCVVVDPRAPETGGCAWPERSEIPSLPTRPFAESLRHGNLPKNPEHVAVGSTDRRVARVPAVKKRTGGALFRANPPVRSTPGLTKRRQGPRAAATFGVLTDLAV